MPLRLVGTDLSCEVFEQFDIAESLLLYHHLSYDEYQVMTDKKLVLENTTADGDFFSSIIVPPA